MNRPPRHHPPARRFAGWQRQGLYAVGHLLLLSGLGWLGVHYLLGAGRGELPHPLEAWLMRLHGLAAEGALFVLGIVSAVHLPPGWQASRRHRLAQQRVSGLLLCTLAVLLAASGYALYYFAPEGLRASLGWAHAGAGAAMALTIAAHARAARRRRGRVGQRSQSPNAA